MQRKIKKIFKFLIAVLTTVCLVGLAGLWRLSLHPIQFGRESAILKHIPQTIQFSQAFLKAGSFYTIPELELTNVVLSVDEAEIKTPNLSASWNLLNIFRGDFKISSVRLLDPKIFIKTNKDQETSLEEALTNFFTDIPVKYMELQNAHILFEEYEIKKANMGVLKLSKKANFHLSGEASSKKIQSLDFALKGQFDYGSRGLSADLKCNKVILSTLPLPLSLEEYASFYKDPIDFETSFNWDPTKENFDFDTNITFNFPKISPYTVKVRGEQKENGQTLLSIIARQIDLPVLAKIWLPLGLDARRWVFSNMMSGKAQNINLRFVLQKNKKDLLELIDLKGELDVSGASLIYHKGIPPLHGVSGHVAWTLDALSCLVKKAHINDLKLFDSEIYLSDLQQSILKLDGKINFKSSCPTLAWYLNHVPFKNHVPKGLDAYGGESKGTIHLAFPLEHNVQGEKVSFDLDATITNGDFSLTYEDRKVSLKKTNLTIAQGKEFLKVVGTSNISGFESSIFWHENYEKEAAIRSKKEIKGAGSLKGLLAIMPPFLQSQIQNPKGGDVTLSFVSEENNNGISKIELDVDLSKSSIVLPALDWTKAKGVPAKLEIDLETRQNHVHAFKRLSFSSKGLTLKGNARLNEKGTISEIYLNPFIVKGAQGSASAFIKNNLWEVVVKMPFVHLNPILWGLKSLSSESKKKGENFSVNLDLKIGTLFLQKKQVYKNLSLFTKIKNAQVQLLKAVGVDENQPFSIRYYPEGGNMLLELDMPRLDTFFKGLDISDKVMSKQVKIQASKPLKDPTKSFEGKLFIERLHVLDVSTFAKLLSLVSIDGLVRGLREKGIVFDDNYAEFEYKDQQIALHRARVMNSSIGITAQGYLDLKRKSLDLEGVLVPANFLNQLLGNIPFIGSLLTGGNKDEGLFSVSYKAQGPLDNPEIKSNPLGIVAPNALKAFFSGITKGKKEKPTL